jgi:hypothetical protein
MTARPDNLLAPRSPVNPEPYPHLTDAELEDVIADWLPDAPRVCLAMEMEDGALSTRSALRAAILTSAAWRAEQAA